MPEKDVSRRELLRGAAVAGVAAGLSKVAGAVEETEPPSQARTMVGVPFERRDRVRIGMIGVGGRGQGLLNDLLAIDGVEMRAICDIVPARLKESQARIQRSGQPAA